MTFNEICRALDQKVGEDNYEVKFWRVDGGHGVVLTVYANLDGEPFDHKFDTETVITARDYDRERAFAEAYEKLLKVNL